MQKYSVAKRRFAGISVVSVASLLLGSVFAVPANAAPAEVKSIAAQEAPATSASAPTDRFVVKFSGAPKTSSTARDQTYEKVSGESGIAVDEVKTTATGAQVIKTDKALSQSDANKLLTQLHNDPNVVSAEPDPIALPTTFTPTDAMYPNQWHLNDDSIGGLRISNAWKKTTGAGQVVAVIDTGITKHSDLDANILPGYDMISDPTKSRDGDGRDANPQDEGDWRSYQQCPTASAQADSSWHGTIVAGAIAATANTQGVVGVAPGVKIVPIRALGTCGGYMSDISDSIIWASGASVAGVPDNANPAKIINLSLTGSGPCLSYVQSAIDTAVGRGSSVFVAAGNTNSSTTNAAPANCNNVIVVAASSQDGYKASYSNYGPEVDITAPAGDGTRLPGAKSGILTTFNSGTTVPGAETYAEKMGTSLAAPLAASVGALMLAADPTLTPATLEARMKATARPLPGGCASGGCGAGLLDASAALGDPIIESAGATPVINGTGKFGTDLSVSTGNWTPSDLTFTYQWNRYGQPIDGETKPTLSLPDTFYNSTITVDVTGRKQGYTTVTKTSAPITVISGDYTAPKPVITGTVEGGGMVSTNADAWAPQPQSVNYQWNIDGVSVSSGTWNSYYLPAEDAGKQLTVTVTGSGYPYNTTAVTSDPVTVGTPALIPGDVSISGQATPGNYLQVSTGQWSPAPITLSFQWKRNGVDIPGENSQTYLMTDSDAGAVISAAVTGTKDNYPSKTVTASADPVVSGTLTYTQAAIEGSPVVGSTVDAYIGDWGPAPVNMTYQWQRDGAAIAGATSKYYAVSPDDAGKQLSVVVTGTKSGYTTVTVTSPSATVQNGSISAGNVTISGSPNVGVKLTANAGGWSPSTAALSYQWKQNGVDISGATSSTYVLTPQDAGKSISVAVTGSNAGYDSTTVVSPSTATVGLGSLTTVAPKINGTAKVGYLLTATTDAWGPAPVALKYQWYRSGVIVLGAINATYALTGNDAGKLVSVTVTGSKDGYATASVSTTTTAVAAGTLTTALPAVTGTSKVGYTLTANPGVWSTGTSITYQWYRSGVSILGAKYSTYALGAADLGKRMTVRVTGTQNGYTSAYRDSGMTVAVVAGTLTRSTPKITGTLRYGYTLTANPGTWTSGTTLYYQWYRSGAAISGATGKTYRLSYSDRWKTMTVRVTGYKAGYTSSAIMSYATARVY